MVQLFLEKFGGK